MEPGIVRLTNKSVAAKEKNIFVRCSKKTSECFWSWFRLSQHLHWFRKLVFWRKADFISSNQKQQQHNGCERGKHCWGTEQLKWQHCGTVESLSSPVRKTKKTPTEIYFFRVRIRSCPSFGLKLKMRISETSDFWCCRVAGQTTQDGAQKLIEEIRSKVHLLQKDTSLGFK